MTNTNWNELLEKHPEGNFLQSTTWAETNHLSSHAKTFFSQIGENGLMLSIVRDAKRGRYLEIAGGPLINWHNKKTVAAATEEMIRIAKENKCVFVRFRPQLAKNDENMAILAGMGAKVAPMHLAAEQTVIIDLTKSLDTILANMRRQTRYEVRRSEKMGIKVDCSNDEAIFKEFHDIQSATAKRQNFVPPSFKMLSAERQAFGDDAKIYVARTEKGEPIAYGLIIRHGQEAEYYEAASTDLNHKLPGAYALIWNAIKDLKEQGVKRFNLWGIAPKNQPHHRYAGVTTFKTGFGGEVVEFVPAHDIIINKAKYIINYIVETMRKKWRHL